VQIKTSEPELIVNTRAELGEGPVWDSEKGMLYWVDIRAGELHCYSPMDRSDRAYSVGEMIGCVAPAEGGVILALQTGFARYDFTRLTRLADPESHLPGNRFNDGKCDPRGRFLAGTMDDAEKESSGSLYALSPDGSIRTLLTGVRISNGLTWSPDYQTFYYIDTPTRKVMAYDYDPASGAIANGRTAVTIPAELGWPDGMTSDRSGRLWVAMWGGAAITVWEQGKLIEKISIPALNVTACVFGGANLDVLYVTSARKGLSEAELSAYPLTGGLFRIQTNVQGLPTFRFGG
jgi:sugar lactone lactonase YvrE